MTIGEVISLMRGAVTEIISIIAPVLGLALIVGLIVAILQAVTSIQEQTLTVVPKIIGIFLTLMLLGNWIMTNIVDYTTKLWSTFVYYVHK